MKGGQVGAEGLRVAFEVEAEAGQEGDREEEEEGGGEDGGDRRWGGEAGGDRWGGGWLAEGEDRAQLELEVVEVLLEVGLGGVDAGVVAAAEAEEEAEGEDLEDGEVGGGGCRECELSTEVDEEFIADAGAAGEGGAGEEVLAPRFAVGGLSGGLVKEGGEGEADGGDVFAAQAEGARLVVELDRCQGGRTEVRTGSALGSSQRRGTARWRSSAWWKQEAQRRSSQAAGLRSRSTGMGLVQAPGPGMARSEMRTWSGS